MQHSRLLREGGTSAVFGMHAARSAWFVIMILYGCPTYTLCRVDSPRGGVSVPKPEDFAFELPNKVKLTNSNAKILPSKRRRPVGRIDIDKKHTGRLSSNDTNPSSRSVEGMTMEESIARIEIFGDSFTNAITYSGVFTAVVRDLFKKEWADVDLVVYSGGASNFADNHLKSIEKNPEILIPESTECGRSTTKKPIETECNRFFDAIILQEQTQVPGYFPDELTIGPKMICPLCTFNYNRSLLALSRIAEEISQFSPSVPVIMFQTWGRLNGDKTNEWMYGDFQKMNSRMEFGYEIYKLLLQNQVNQLPETYMQKMAQNLPFALETFKTVSPIFSESNSVTVAPCGTAFANVRLIEHLLLSGNDAKHLKESRNPYFNLSRFNSSMDSLMPVKDWRSHLQKVNSRMRPFRLLFRDNGHPSPACGAYVASVTIALAWKLYLGETGVHPEESWSSRVEDNEKETEEHRNGENEQVHSSELNDNARNASASTTNSTAGLYSDLEKRQHPQAAVDVSAGESGTYHNSKFPNVRSMLMSFLPRHFEAQKILMDSKIGDKVLEKNHEFLGENCFEFIDIYHEAIVEAIIQHNPEISVGA